MSDRTEELRKEARETMPEFSPSLHAKVMAAVRAEAAASSQPAGQRWRYALAAAAMVVIAAGTYVLTRPAAIAPPPPTPLARDFSIGNPLPDINLALASEKGN